LQQARPGDKIKAALVVNNPQKRKQKLAIVLEGRGVFPDQTWNLDMAEGGTVRRNFEVTLAGTLPAGRNVFTLRVLDGDRADASDAFLAVDFLSPKR